MVSSRPSLPPILSSRPSLRAERSVCDPECLPLYDRNEARLQISRLEDSLEMTVGFVFALTRLPFSFLVNFQQTDFQRLTSCVFGSESASRMGLTCKSLQGAVPSKISAIPRFSVRFIRLEDSLRMTQGWVLLPCQIGSAAEPSELMMINRGI